MWGGGDQSGNGTQLSRAGNLKENGLWGRRGHTCSQQNPEGRLQKNQLFLGSITRVPPEGTAYGKNGKKKTQIGPDEVSRST